MSLGLRVRLRTKLAILSLLLLALPWVGYQYVKEMESFLLEGQREALVATARAVATALHDRPLLMRVRPRAGGTFFGPSGGLLPGEELLEPALPAPFQPRPDPLAVAEVEAILRGLERTTSRIWVVNRDLRVLAQAGDLQVGQAVESTGWTAFWRPWLSRMVTPPGGEEEIVETLDAVVTGREIVDALTMGAPGSRVRRIIDGQTVVVSAAHPIWSGDQVLGAVVVEESTQSILSLRNRALERLFLLTLAGFALAAVLVFGFAQRLSSRIRRLSSDAENAIDNRGRITPNLSGSEAGDEVGDLSRSFTRLLERLSRHQNYLESMASRLSHELRTPIAVVRSSLENLRTEPLPEGAQTYMQRADAGLSRLSRILSRMSEATRLEQALAATETERFDLRLVVAECVNGYRMAYPQQRIESSLPGYPVWVRGAPDLAAQMLDKLVENAADFAVADTPLEINLAFDGAGAKLSVTNRGPLLPPELEGQLFESMVSARKRDGGGEPHLGLGLFVARIIADFHDAKLAANNLPSGDGVCFSVAFRLA